MKLPLLSVDSTSIWTWNMQVMLMTYIPWWLKLKSCWRHFVFVNLSASSANGSFSPIGFPPGPIRALRGQLTPASKKVIMHVSFGINILNREPLAMNSTIPSGRVDRCKYGRNCLLRWRSPCNSCTRIAVALSAFSDQRPFLSFSACASAANSKSYWEERLS